MSDDQFRILRVSTFADYQAPRPTDPRLKLAYPLALRKIQNGGVSSNGDTFKTELTIEYIGRNRVKHIVEAQEREIETSEARERTYKFHTQVFESLADTVPVEMLDKTVTMKTVTVRLEGDYRWDDLYLTIEDREGVHKMPVMRSRTFFRERVAHESRNLVRPTLPALANLKVENQ